MSQGVAVVDWKPHDACGHEIIEPTPMACAERATRRTELGDDAAMSGDANSLTRLDAPYVVAQVVLELTDTCRGHPSL